MQRLGILTMLALATAAQSWADDLGSGKKLYTTKCARCHKFYDPNAYDDAKWNDWMGKMRMKAHLTDEQYAQLSSYLRSVRVEAKTK